MSAVFPIAIGRHVRTTLLAGVVVACAALLGCAPEVNSFRVEVPMGSSVDVRVSGPERLEVSERRVPGATLLEVTRYRPCEVVLRRSVMASDVVVRKAHPATSALYFAGTGALALGGAGMIAALSPTGERDPSIPLVATLVAVAAAGAASLGVAIGSSARANDRVRDLGSMPLDEVRATRCSEGPAGEAAVALLSGTGEVVEEGMTDPEGRWMIYGAGAGEAVSLRLGEATRPVDLSALSCSVEELDLLDSVMVRADAAVRVDGGLVAGSHHLGRGGIVREWGGPAEVHLFAFSTASPAITDVGDAMAGHVRGTVSEWEEKVRAATAGAGLRMVSRAGTVVNDDVWAARVSADACYLMLVYFRR